MRFFNFGYQQADCDSVQATCEPSACHGAVFIAPLIRCDIFSLGVFCLYLKRSTQGTLLKSAEACEYVRMHLCEREGENGFFYLLGIWRAYFTGAYKGERRCCSRLKQNAVPPLLAALRGQGKAECKLFP